MINVNPIQGPRAVVGAAGKVSRRLIALAAAVALTACAQRATSTVSPVAPAEANDELPLACVHSDTGAHVLTISGRDASTEPGSITGIIRGTDHELIRNASVITLQPLSGGPNIRARADSSGRFTIAKVSPGSYELRVVSIGYLTSRDTIAVTPAGMSLALTQVIMRFLDEQVLCSYLAAIDSEPVLTLARPHTASTTHTVATGGSVQATVTVRPNADGATFDMLFRNVGTDSATMTRLCYPSVVGEPVRRFPGRVGPACYGIGVTLAPGDTLGVHQSVQLRGRPGTYTLRVHAADPPSFDAVIPLNLVRGVAPGRKP